MLVHTYEIQRYKFVFILHFLNKFLKDRASLCAGAPGGGGAAAASLRRGTFDDDKPANWALPLALHPRNDAFLMKHVVAGCDGDELLRLEIFQENRAPLAYVVVGRAAAGLVA